MRVNRKDLLNIKTLIENDLVTEKSFTNREIAKQLILNGSVTSTRKGTIKYIHLSKKENVFLLLKNHNYNIGSIEEIDSYIKNIFDNAPSRDIIQYHNNSSKAKTSKSMHGLYVSSLQKLDVLLNGKRVSILPNDGLGYFFFHTQKIELFEDTIVVGVENYQVAWFAKRYENFFTKPNILFVVTTPYMLEWISSLENEYIHFGDYDLAGINIYLNKVLPRLLKSKKYSMFIPQNIEQLIENHGISALYENQKQYKNLLTNNVEINSLIEIIIKYKKGIEQEGLTRLKVLKIT